MQGIVMKPMFELQRIEQEQPKDKKEEPKMKVTGTGLNIAIELNIHQKNKAKEVDFDYIEIMHPPTSIVRKYFLERAQKVNKIV